MQVCRSGAEQLDLQPTDVQLHDAGREGQKVVEMVGLGVVRADRPHVKGKVRCGREGPC
jgi:hypothetical protein